MSHHKKSLTPGIILISIGSFLLLRRFFNELSFWNQISSALVLILACFLIWVAFQHKNHSALFWGTFLFCLGIFLALRNFNFIPYMHIEEYWPVLMIALGIAFIVKFIAHPDDWGVLIPGTILLFFGIKSTVGLFTDFLWEYDFYIEDFWPLIIISIGAGIVISGFRKRTN